MKIEGGGVSFHTSRTVTKAALAVLPPSSWCREPAMLAPYDELAVSLLQNHSFAAGGQRENKEMASTSLHCSQMPHITLVPHQGSGVLRFWGMAEAQPRQSRREVGKFLPASPALEARVPWHTVSTGALGIYQVAGIYEKPQVKSNAQPPYEVRPLPLCCALVGGCRGRKGWPSSTMIPTLTP